MKEIKVMDIFEASLFLVLWFAGAVVNVMLMVMFIIHPEIRTPENVLLINLCVADLVYLLSFLSKIIVVPCNKTVCLGLSFWRSFMLAIGAYSVVAISIQRYRGIIKLDNRLLEDEKNYKKPICIAIGVWIFAILLAALELVFVIYNYNSLDCTPDIGDSSYRMYLYAFVPVIVVSYCYAVASCKIRRSANNIPGIQHEALAQLRERRRKSANVILTLTTSFYLTYVPYLMFMYMIAHPNEYNFQNVAFFLVAELASVLNPFYNPIALCVASLQFRELYKRYCCCCRKQKHDVASSSIANEQSTNVTQQESQV